MQSRYTVVQGMPASPPTMPSMPSVKMDAEDIAAEVEAEYLHGHFPGPQQRRASLGVPPSGLTRTDSMSQYEDFTPAPGAPGSTRY